MDKIFSPKLLTSQITYVEAEAVEFSRFRFHILGLENNFSAVLLEKIVYYCAHRLQVGLHYLCARKRNNIFFLNVFLGS